jgi:hypothetical protein
LDFLSQDRYDSCARRGQRLFLLGYALTDLIGVATERTNLSPARFGRTFDEPSNIAGYPIHSEPTSTTQLIFMGSHAQHQSTFTRRNPAAKVIDVAGARFFDCLDSVRHAIPEVAVCKAATLVRLSSPLNGG